MKEDKPLLLKYTPNNYDKLRLPKRIKTLIDANKDTIGYRFLFFGSPGLGKTSLAKLLAKGCDVLYLSGSNDFGVQTLRDKVYPFSQQNSVTGKRKICIIDEAENMRNNVQDAFKIVLDQAKSVNFIFITNEVEKMNSAVMSRCTLVEFNFQGQELTEQQQYYVDFALTVCKEEGMQFDNSGVRALYLKNFPDFRSLLVDLQQLKDTKTPVLKENIEVIEQGTSNTELYDIFSIIEPDKFYIECTKFKGKEREAFMALGEPFFKWLNNQNKFDATLKAAVVVSKYANMYTQSMMKFSTFVACMQELRTIIR